MATVRFPMILFAATLIAPVHALAQDEASLRAADQEQRRLVFEGDPAPLDRILHPNMLINGPNGRIVTREMFLESVRTGAIAKDWFERNPER